MPPGNFPGILSWKTISLFGVIRFRFDALVRWFAVKTNEHGLALPAVRTNIVCQLLLLSVMFATSLLWLENSFFLVHTTALIDVLFLNLRMMYVAARKNWHFYRWLLYFLVQNFICVAQSSF